MKTETEEASVKPKSIHSLCKEIQSDELVSKRKKAIKSLSQLIEANSEVFDMPEVQRIVKSRMMDRNGLIREAIIELLGKYLISHPNHFDDYYTTLCDRILDTGIAVRKRVIRIFRDHIDKDPGNPLKAEILSKIVRRVSDEEDGVRKLALDMLLSFWFTPIFDDDLLHEKVLSLIDTFNHLLDYTKGIEMFFTLVLNKEGIDRKVQKAAEQIADTLVYYVFNPDLDYAIEPPISPQQRNSTLTALSIISRIRPQLIACHAEVLYHIIQPRTPVNVVNQIIIILEKVIPFTEDPSESFLKNLSERLCDTIKKRGIILIQSAMACLGAVCKRWQDGQLEVSKLFVQYIAFLSRMNMTLSSNESSPISSDQKANLKRCIFSVGIMCRYFDFDRLIDQKTLSPNNSATDESINDDCPEIICSYLLSFSQFSDIEIAEKAVASLGHLCAEYPRFFDKYELHNIYQQLLANTEDGEKHSQMKIQVLKNLTLFLVVEEEKMVKAREEYNRLRITGLLKDNLADADTRGSLNSSIIERFLKYVLASYLHRNDGVRLAVSQLVYQMKNLVTPVSFLPTMIAMAADPALQIQSTIEPLLKEVDRKHNGVLASKATNGVRWTFGLYHLLNINKNVLRGFKARKLSKVNDLDVNGLPKKSTEAVAILHALYACLKTTRNQRRIFLQNIIKMFVADVRNETNVEELLFIADNLVTFNYQLMDEPLYVINSAAPILAFSGQKFLTSFKEMLSPPENENEDEFTAENIYRRLPEDKSQIFNLLKGSQACFLLLYIKVYLQKLYDLSDRLVKEYQPTSLAKTTDKLIVRQKCSVFHPDLTLAELHSNVLIDRSSEEGLKKLCEQLVYFRNMFLALDIHIDAEGDDDDSMESDEETTIEPPPKKLRS